MVTKAPVRDGATSNNEAQFSKREPNNLAHSFLSCLKLILLQNNNLGLTTTIIL